jgi:hypothetical protein
VPEEDAVRNPYGDIEPDSDLVVEVTLVRESRGYTAHAIVPNYFFVPEASRVLGGHFHHWRPTERWAINVLMRRVCYWRKDVQKLQLKWRKFEQGTRLTFESEECDDR